MCVCVYVCMCVCIRVQCVSWFLLPASCDWKSPAQDTKWPGHVGLHDRRGYTILVNIFPCWELAGWMGNPVYMEVLLGKPVINSPFSSAMLITAG